MNVYDGGRKPVALSRQLARGGQGAVYAVDRQPGTLAKLYMPMPAEGQEDKLRWMVAHPPADPSAPLGHASIAWPSDLLYDAQRRFLGYLMPYVQNAVPILEVFNPRRRAATLPGFDRRYLHRAARNMAAALAALHEGNYIVGDLNESNVLVTPQALVTVIDTDSFQVQEQRSTGFFIHPCPVGKPEYTAPEVQGQSFVGVVRRWEHDAFALGVLIFQMLMEGNHPFRARWLGQGDPPPLEERIRRGYFPYLAEDEPAPMRQANGGTTGAELVRPAPGVPPLDILHPQLVWLFRRCFIEGHDFSNRRPVAREWERALAEAERNLVECANGHIYDSHAKSCPLCGLSTPVARPATGSAQPARGGGPGAGQGTGRASGQARAQTGTAAGTRKRVTGGGTGRRPGGAAPGGARGPVPGGQAPAGGWHSITKMLGQAIVAYSTGAAPKAAGSSPFEQWWQRMLQQLASSRQASGGPGQASSGPTAAAAAAAAGSPFSAPTTRACPRCGFVNGTDEIYCQRCREILTATRPCPHCGKPMPQNARFCVNCSKRL